MILMKMVTSKSCLSTMSFILTLCIVARNEDMDYENEANGNDAATNDDTPANGN